MIGEYPKFEIHWYKNDKMNWYNISIYRELESSIEWILKYNEIVSWMKDNIENHIKHTRYIIHPEHLGFKFRYERNYIIFNLKWL